MMILKKMLLNDVNVKPRGELLEQCECMAYVDKGDCEYCDREDK